MNCTASYFTACLVSLSVLAAAASAQGAAPESTQTTNTQAAAELKVYIVRVWVNRSSGVYHCPGTRYYGHTKRGAFISETEARKSGYRPAYGKTCGAIVDSTEAGVANPSTFQSSTATRLAGSSTPSEGSSTRVWVNQSSHVYHCPGTRYYGATKRGQFMTESEAVSAGNRPAYGKTCS
jgi:hypothetical protein